jgi:hypothetical protein
MSSAESTSLKKPEMKIHDRRAPSCITRPMRIPRASRSIATATLLLVGFVSADESDHGLTILSASPDEGLPGSEK